MPLFEDVHQMAIERVLSDQIVDPVDVEIVKDQQTIVDDDQGPKESFEHSMTGVLQGETRDGRLTAFVEQAEAFVRTCLDEAIQARRGGTPNVALQKLGMAMHPLQDATSPVHKVFQSWSYKETWWSMTRHVMQEKAYPDDPDDQRQVDFRKDLEGVVRWAYDIYMERTVMPARFFATDGRLMLPESYRH